MKCDECGNEMTVDENGISNHLTKDGEIDYDQDANHVAYSTEESQVAHLECPKCKADTVIHCECGECSYKWEHYGEDKTLDTLKEQIQENLRCFLDGMSDEIIDGACECVLSAFNDSGC